MPISFQSPSTRHTKLLTCIGLGLMLLPATAAQVPLDTFQATLGWTSRVVRADCIDISDGTNRVRFFPGLRRTEINGVAVWLHAIAEPAGDKIVTLDTVDIEKVLNPILRPAPASRREMRVMLDPGHGGEDGGAAAIKPRLQEKDFVLDLAHRIGKRLEAEGVTVGYTRANDTYLTLSERAETAAVWRADAFVSLHANFAQNTRAIGRETYVLPLAGYASTSSGGAISDRSSAGNSNDICNTLLGYSIHRQLPGRLQADDRGLRRARFQVLRQAPCPATLIEFGFFSNPREAKLLASGWYRDRLARAVADGLLDYARYVTTNVVPHGMELPLIE